MNSLADQLASLLEHQQKQIEYLHKQIRSNNLFIDLLKYHLESHSQFMQDIFVLRQTNYQRGGFFVEFGACDGISLSNTYLLEKNFGWTGILAEPAKKWHPLISKNRSAFVDYRCVWSKSGDHIQFIETSVPELSTIESYEAGDLHSGSRKLGEPQIYSVETVSLTNLLETYNAPRVIDYLSIDTEGSELEILSNFDFSRYKTKIITVEHNWTSNRDLIFQLLSKKNFRRVHEDLTGCDDWYVNLDFYNTPD